MALNATQSVPPSNGAASKSRPSVAVIGLESVGKSSLMSALTGRFAESSALAVTTLRCEVYRDDSLDWVDTPGLLTDSDAPTVRDALSALEFAESVVLVLRAHRAKEELDTLRPWLGSRKVAIALTFRDRLETATAEEEQAQLQAWKDGLQAPIVLLDGRSPAPSHLIELRAAAAMARPLPKAIPDQLPRFRERNRRSVGSPWSVSSALLPSV